MAAFTTPIGSKSKLLARVVVYPAFGLFVLGGLVQSSLRADGVGSSAEMSDAELAASDRDLARRQSAVTARLAYKEALLEDLAGNRVTLRQAGETFLRLNSAEETCLEAVRLAYPGRTDLEKSARNVIDFARSLPMPVDQKRALLARLDAELAREFPRS